MGSRILRLFSISLVVAIFFLTILPSQNPAFALCSCTGNPGCGTYLNSTDCQDRSCTWQCDTSPIPTPRRPRAVSPSWAPIMKELVPCSKTRSPEFHPLRPYPANACDPLIPRKTPEAIKNLPNKLYLTFQCGKSANPQGTYGADEVVKIGYSILPTNLSSVALTQENNTRSRDYLCQANSGEICFIKQITASVTLNFKDTQLPILGDTQDFLSDTAKVNRYLSWYLEGTIQQSDHLDLDTTKPEDVTRIVNYSGPIKKLLSRQSQIDIHNTIKGGRQMASDYHNYIVIDPSSTRISDVNIRYVNIPLSSLEDITGEITTSVISSAQPRSPEIDGSILSIGLSIGSADSRLYFPHLKETNALSQLLASTFKPNPTGIPPAPTPIMTDPNPIDVNDSKFLSQWISMHQGPPGPPYLVPRGADDTVVQTLPKVNNEIVRNTELREFMPAPPPLYAAPSVKCDLTPVRTNPGDDLVGSAVNTVVTYRQLFRYFPKLIIGTSNACANILDVECKPEGSCVEQNQQCTGSGSCCYGECPAPTGGCVGDLGNCSDFSYPGSCTAAGCTWTEYSSEACCVCDGTCSGIGAHFCDSAGCEWRPPDPPPTFCPKYPPDRALKSKAYISVYTKVPFVDRIYENIIAGPQSVLRRFLPGETNYTTPSPVFQYGSLNPNSALPAGSGASYTGYTTSLENFSVQAGEGGSGMLYFPRVGSILDHFLGDGAKYTDQNIQCFFWPKGYCGSHNLACNDFEDKLTETGEGDCGICNSPLSPLARKILAQAGATYNVSAAHIYATMLHEGGDWKEFNDFSSDEDVRKWSVSKECGGEDMPRCNNDDPYTQPPFGWLKGWFYQGDSEEYSPWNAITKFLPERDTKEKISRCNFLDAAFATAKALHNDSAMTNTTYLIPAPRCGPYTFTDNVRPTSCTWTDTKVAQAQMYYGGQCPDNMNPQPFYLIEEIVNLVNHTYSCN